MNRDLIVFDWETGSRDAETCQVTQIAALALDPRNFRLKGTFNSEIWAFTNDDEARAEGLAPLEEDALRITRKTRENIAAAPKLKTVWPKFVQFVNKYNWKGTPFFAPIPAGYNINNFDLPIARRMCKKFGPWDKKDNKPTLFSSVYKIDVMDDMYLWTEADSNVKSISMKALRERFGMKSDDAHDALQDVKDTANIMIKLMKTRRIVYRNLDFEKAFADGLYIE